MPRKVSESEKKGILETFRNGMDLNAISNMYSYSKITIAKQLKKILGDEEFEKIKINNKKNSNKKSKLFPQKDQEALNENKSESSNYLEESFFELVPIPTSIDVDKQKDLSSKPLKNFNLPETVYMLIDKKIELNPKTLREYPEWSFLPEDDLDRLTIEIFSEQKFAKKYCTKNQKLIKVPNSKVFLIASQSLKLKGISRIIFNDSLLSI